MKRQQWIVVGVLAGVFCLLGWAGWYFAIKPENRKIAEKLAEKQAAEEKLRDAKAKEAQYEKFQAEAENVRRDLQFVTGRLDPELKYSEMFRTLDAVGNAYNLPNYRFKVKKREKTRVAGVADLDEVHIDVFFQCDYDSLGRFLNGLVSQQRLYVPHRFTRVKRLDDVQTRKSSVDVEMELKLFLQSEVKKG